MKKTTLLVALSFFLVSMLSNTGVFATSTNPDHPPFWEAIQKFKQKDAEHFPPKNAILFIGSSSFTKWTDVQDYFPKYPIINRGFGGSSFPDLIRYTDDIVFPYEPKQMVIYCGDNDAASSTDITADSILNRFETFYHKVKERLPNIQVTFVSIKPSPSREKFFPVMSEANEKIKKFLSGEKKTAFVDIWHPMLDKQGHTRPELFGDDMLHMNSQGYKIWQKKIKPHLLK